MSEMAWAEWRQVPSTKSFEVSAFGVTALPTVMGYTGHTLLGFHTAQGDVGVGDIRGFLRLA